MNDDSLLEEMKEAGVDIQNMQEVIRFVLIKNSGGTYINYEKLKQELKEEITKDFEEQFEVLEGLDEKLKVLDDLDEKLKVLADLENSLNEKLESLSKLDEKIKEVEDLYNKLNEKLNSLDDLDEKIKALDTLSEELNTQLDNITNLEKKLDEKLNSLEDLDKKIELLDEKLKVLEDLEEIEEKLKVLDELEGLFVAIQVNLFNKENEVVGFRLNGVGAIGAVAGAKHTGFISIKSGESYTISWSNQVSDAPFYSFFATNAANEQPITYSISAPRTSPLTVIAPEGANYLVVNLKHSATAIERENVQIEQGEIATEYQEYQEPYLQISDHLLNKDIVRRNELDELTDRLVKGELKHLSLVAGTGTIKCGPLTLGVKIFNPINQIGNAVFNFNNDSYNDLQIRLNGDDVAPVRMLGATIGANHGYARSNLTLANHGKTVEDIGSIWSDGSNQWVIVQINSDSIIGITCLDRQLAYSTSLLPMLTHVSGAVHTEEFKPTSARGAQWYSMLKNHSIKLFIDEQEITETTGNWNFFNSVKVVESYDLMEKNAMAEWLVQNGGKEVLSYDAESALNVNNIHEFNSDGTDVITCNFFTYKDLSVAQDLMFTQSARLRINTDGPIQYYVPRSIPFVHEGNEYDFSVPRIIDDLVITARIDFTLARTEEGKVLPDRLIQLNNTIGYATGYLPILDASSEVRNSLTSKGIQISNSESKVYPYLIDGLTTLNAGAHYSCVAYRKYFKRPEDLRRTIEYDIHSEHGDFLFLDWHQGNFIDVVNLPVYMQTRKFEVIEITENIELLTKVATGHIAVKLNQVEKNARLILKFY